MIPHAACALWKAACSTIEAVGDVLSATPSRAVKSPREYDRRRGLRVRIEPLENRLLYSGVPYVSGPTSVDAGAAYTLNLTANGKPVDHWTIDWGDGSSGQADAQTVAGSAITASHVYLSGGSDAITATEIYTKGKTISTTSLGVVPAAQTDGVMEITQDELSQIDGQNVTVESVYALPSGKMLVLTSAGLDRFNADGSPDTTFGTGSVAPLPVIAGAAGRALTFTMIDVNAAGQIAIGGAGKKAWDIAQYSPAGKLSHTRSEVAASQPTRPAQAVSLSFQGHQVLLLGEDKAGTNVYWTTTLSGVTNVASTGQDAPWTYNDGAIDDATGGDGSSWLVGSDGTAFYIAHYSSTGTEYSGTQIPGDAGTNAGAIAIDASGNLLVGRQLLSRFLPGGGLDMLFGSGGQTPLPAALQGGVSQILSLSNGQILVVGVGFQTIARYDSNGSLDTTFGASGVLSTGLVNNVSGSLAELAGGNYLAADTNGTNVYFDTISSLPSAVSVTADSGPSVTLSGTAALPSYTYVTPSSNPPAPAGWDVFNPPVGGIVAAGAPVIDASNLTAAADNSITVTGNLLTADTGYAAFNDTQFFVYGQTNASNGLLNNGAIQTSSLDGVTMTISAQQAPDSMFLVWPSNANGVGSPIAVNATDATWVGPGAASDGQTVSVYGQNLSNGAATPQSWVYLQPASGSGQWATVTSANRYQVQFTVPSDLPAGTYQVWVSNGLGAQYGWSKAPTPLTITASSQSQATFNVSDYGAKGNGTHDDGPAIESAIGALQSWQTGHPNQQATLSFPAGTFLVTSVQINIPDNVLVQGAGESGTKLLFNGNLQQFNSTNVSDGTYAIGSHDGWSGHYLGGANITFDAMTLQYSGGPVDYSSAANSSSYGELFRQRSGANLTLDNVTLIGGDDVSPLDWQGSSQVSLENSTVVGQGISLIGATDAQINNDTFYMAYNTQAAITIWAASDISITNSTAEDDTGLLAGESAANGFGQGRILEQGLAWGDVYNIYFGNNQTLNLASPVAGNDGEQVLSEGAIELADTTPSAVGSNWITLPVSALSQGSLFTAPAKSSTATTVTLSAPAGAWPYAGQLIHVTSGPDAGQLQFVTSVSPANPQTGGPANQTATITVASAWATPPTSSSSLAVYNPPVAGESITVTNGPGIGQQQAITSVTITSSNQIQLSFAGAWIVQPGVTSDILVGSTEYNAVFYDNTLADAVSADGATDGPVPGGLQAATGFKVYTGGYNLVFDGNTLNDLNVGVSLSSAAVDNPDEFIEVVNNQINNAHQSGVELLPATPSGEANEIGVNIAGNTIAWNNSQELQNAVAMNTLPGLSQLPFANSLDNQSPVGISVGGNFAPSSMYYLDPHSGVPQADLWTPGGTTATLSVLEHNDISTDINNTSLIGIGAYQDPDVLAYANTFSATAFSANAVAIGLGAPIYTIQDLINGVNAAATIRTTPGIQLLDNTYQNFGQSYEDAITDSEPSSRNITGVSINVSTSYGTTTTSYQTGHNGLQQTVEWQGVTRTPLRLVNPVLSAGTPELYVEAAADSSPFTVNIPIFNDGYTAISLKSGTLIGSTSSPGLSLSFADSSGNPNGAIAADSAGYAVLTINPTQAGTGVFTLSIMNGGQTQQLSLSLTLT